ncbi:MAG: flagellar basal body P-ring protein FlgI [Pseudomonadota bacterium]
MLRFILIFLIPCFSALADTRIKDIASVEGVRDNQLVGIGLATGLSGSGDNLQNAVFTQKGLTDFLERLGVNIQGANLKTKNIAAVTVTANLPPFARQGGRIDVRVSAIGDAKSLRGGMLLATPLLGADGGVYAVAQGPITISEFVPSSKNVKTQITTIETNGSIQNGAIVENEIDFHLGSMDNIKFSLHYPDFTTAMAVANAINDAVPGNTASALDSATIAVVVPSTHRNDVVEFISQIERLKVSPDYKAKIVISEATGTVVIGDKVQIRPVAIAQGNLVINVGDRSYEKNLPMLPEAQQDSYMRGIDMQRGTGVANLNESATLSELVSGLNTLGVWPRDIINILHDMKSVGAIDAVIEVK